ncbi:MAG TPA: hypothetical protein VMU04_22255 [Candidatus Acidoferrum sp.]|nr:hypothetical protein [Candidatus Acidoferrum sp.]
MSANLIKETRELLLVVLGTLALIIVPFLLNGADAAPFATVAFVLGAFVLGGCCFGNEFQHRTFPLLLSQPISRSVLWREKMLALGAGIVTCLAALGLCRLIYGRGSEGEEPGIVVMIALCAFCGAPYFTLVCRHAIAGMAVATGFPVLLLLLGALLTGWWLKNEAVELTGAVMLVTLYCAAVLWSGHARFRALEVFDAAAPEISLPAGLEAALARPMARASSRLRGAFGSLLRKEFRIQQVSFLLAGALILIAAAGCCVIPIYRELAVGIIAADYGTFMLVLPLVAGAMAVAEERGWGLAEWHLTLPPSARQQWSAKMLVTLPTSLGLGLLLPGGMFLVIRALLHVRGPGPDFPLGYGLASLALGQLLVTSLAMYAGSCSRTTLRAILAVFGILITAYPVVSLAAIWGARGTVPPALSALLFRFLCPLDVQGIALFLMLCLVQWLAWSNFRRSGTPIRRLTGQFFGLLLAAGLVSAVIAHLAHPILR